MKESNRRLEGRRALVTGGSRGIGAAIVQRLAEEGADVALTYVSRPEPAEASAAAARELGVRAIAIQADSRDAAAVVAAVERTVAKLEIAAMVAYLAGPEAGYVTGASLSIDGGFTA
jgi:3-oxoacyl-[acyl-carrier protein] reductase